MPTYVPANISAAGLTIAGYQAILQYLIQQYQSIYGSTVYLGTDSADYQDIAVRALQASDVNSALQAVYLSMNPQTAIGVSLDLIGKLIGTERKQATFSSALLTLSGAPFAVITNGVAQDIQGNLWTLASPITLNAGGTATAIATAQELGNITANPGAIILIATPTAGWTAVTNPSPATPGQAVEPDSSYRARLLIAQAKPSLTVLAGTAAAVAAVSGVTRSVVFENQYGYTAGYGLVNVSGTAVTLLVGYPFDSSDASQPITINGVQYSIASVGGPGALTLTSSAGTQSGVPYFIGTPYSLGPAHSITAVVEGGTTTDIAQAIYDNKNPGVLTNGMTTVTITDPLNGLISMPISFDVLAYIEIYVSIGLHPLTGYSSVIGDAIAAAVLLYLDSLGIGETVVYSQLYAVAASAQPNPLQPVFSIRSLISGSQAASTTANTTASSNVIVVTSATGIANGQSVVGTGIPANTTVSSFTGTSITLSANATTTATGVPVAFFTTGTVDIPIQFNNAPISTSAQIVVASV